MRHLRYYMLRSGRVSEDNLHFLLLGLNAVLDLPRLALLGLFLCEFLSYGFFYLVVNAVFAE